MFNFFKPKEKKSYSPGFSSLFGLDNFFTYSNSSEFLGYYETNSAVATALKLISDNCSSIPFQVRDKKSGKFIEGHEVLKLLAAPNPCTSGSLFEKELIGFYVLTGNNYLNIIGSGKPTELYNLNPASVTINPNNQGYPGSYNYSSGAAGSAVFKNINDIFSANESSFLSHLRNFNPKYGSNNLYGVSELKACEIEIALHTLANIHNHSLLKNQARPSGIITYEGDGTLSDDQIDAISKNIKQELSGSGNAGRAAFLSGSFKWTQLSESMKDMDFATLYKRTAESIYNTLKIPLPMVSPDNMTLANMDTAKMNLFDNVIIPLKTIICQYLTKSLMYKYDKTGNLEITFDESEVEVLKPREVKNALEISKAGILTRNEIRQSIGFDPLKDERGEEIVGTNRQTPPVESVKSNIEAAEIKGLLSSLKNEKGDPIYSDEFIKSVIQ